MRAYQPLLVAVIVGLLLTGCYYLPNGGATGDLAFVINTRAFTTFPTFEALQIQLYFEEDTLFLAPLPIGQGGALTLDVPIPNSNLHVHGPFTIANILARRRYIMKVRTWYSDGTSSWPASGEFDSSAFEVLPGETTEVSISFGGV